MLRTDNNSIQLENLDDKLDQDRNELKPNVNGSLNKFASASPISELNNKISARRSHRRKRSQYYEAEVHSSEATVESFELPSTRLERSMTILDVMGRASIKSKHSMTNKRIDRSSAQGSPNTGKI